MAATDTVSTEFADLKASAPFRRMTGQQQLWLLEFLRSGSIHDATKAAYPAASKESQHSMSYQVPKSNAIRECLELLRWRDAESSRQALIDIVRKQLDAAEAGSVSAQRLCAQLQSLTVVSKPSAPEPAPGPEEPTQARGSKVGDIILQGNQKYRVTSVGADGHPLTATEVQ
jgi:hypothetical protein